MDFLTKKERSYRMSLIRGKDTKHEILLRKALWREGMRFSKYCRLPGTPDIVFRKWKVVIFCDGCFWHGCPRHYVLPKSRRGYWRKKVEGNRKRDILVTRALEKAGWTVVRVWECEINKNLKKTVHMIRRIVARRKY
jgi:DNA mismatch endonuclease (patch repair protein)